MTYLCVKCKRTHTRGSIFEEHVIYDSNNSPEITEDMKNNPWSETCYDCKHHDKMLDQGGHYCKLLRVHWEQYYQELSSFGWNYTIPKAAFRVPRTSEIYRKCKYHKQEAI